MFTHYNDITWNLHRRVEKLLLFILIVINQCSAFDKLPEGLDDPRIGSEKGAIHVVTSTECGSNYLVYQAWAQKYTFDLVQQPGKYTRILSCNEPEKVAKEDLEMMDTLVVPSWTFHINDGDHYPPYNKPIGLIHWLAERKPTAEWTLIVDPDMLFRQPFLPENFEVPKGYAVSAEYNFMVGVRNELAERHLPDVPPRDDTYGGPRGRKADTAGTFYFLRTKDLVKLAPLHLKFTEEVRNDPYAWNTTGDMFTKPGERPWIAEMYGYVFAAATINLWHKIDPTVQYYPNYEVQDIPVLVHYGLNNSLANYWFDKHAYLTFNPMKCPPWNMDFDREPEEDAGLLPHPPFPSTLPKMPPKTKFSQLMVIEVVNTINQALCMRHRRMCGKSEQLETECKTTLAISKALKEEYDLLYKSGRLCKDNTAKCQTFAEEGECERSWLYMNNHCRASCKKCRTYIPRSVSLEEAERGKLTDTETIEENANTEQEALEKVLISRGGMGYLVKTRIEKQTEEESKEQEEAAEIKEDVSIENKEEKIIPNKFIDEAEEILRCKNLDKESFAKDSACLKLAHQHLIKTNEEPTLLTVAMERSAVHKKERSTASYGIVVVALCLLVLILTIKSFCVSDTPKNGIKYQ